MNGKFFKLTYQSIFKIIQAEKTFEQYLIGISKAFSLPLAVIRELTGTFTDKDGDRILINTEMDYSILLNVMEKEKIRTLKITLSKEQAQDQYTQSSEFELIQPTVSQDMTIQTDEVISKHAQIQTEQAKQPEVKEGTSQTNANAVANANGNAKHKIKGKKQQHQNQHQHQRQRHLKYQEGTLQYEQHQARKEIRRKFREEFKLFKKQTLEERYAKSDMEVEKKYKEAMKATPALMSCQCKGCNVSPITGIVYKCIQCVNYYYCEKCEETLSLKHGHCFIKFRPQQLITNQQQKQIEEQHNALPNLDLFLQNINKNIINVNQFLNQQTSNFTNYIKLFNPFNVKTQTQPIMSSSCINKTLDIISKNNRVFQKVSLTLKNEGNVNWPNPCYLSCNESTSIIKGEDVMLNREVAPKSTITVVITLDMTKIKSNGCYMSVWQLEDEKRKKFGAEFGLKIHCSYDNELSYCEPKPETKEEEFTIVSTNNLIQSYESFAVAIKPDYNKLALEMENEYGLKEDKYAIINALMFTDGNKQAAYQNLINKRNNICHYHIRK